MLLIYVLLIIIVEILRIDYDYYDEWIEHYQQISEIAEGPAKFEVTNKWFPEYIY